MTRERLEHYHIIESQIRNFEKQYGFLSSYIAGVDTTKPAVQSGGVADPTADLAINELKVKQEYERLLKEKRAIENYIYTVDDELIRACLIQKHIWGKTWEEISLSLRKNGEDYSARHLRRITNNFIKNNEKNS